MAATFRHWLKQTKSPPLPLNVCWVTCGLDTHKQSSGVRVVGTAGCHHTNTAGSRVLTLSQHLWEEAQLESRPAVVEWVGALGGWEVHGGAWVMCHKAYHEGNNLRRLFWGRTKTKGESLHCVHTARYF